MALDPELLAILACPNCKSPVSVVRNDRARKGGPGQRGGPLRAGVPVGLWAEGGFSMN